MSDALPPRPTEAPVEWVRALDALRRANGRPVTYEEIGGAGVNHPATTIYELELAGAVIDHRPGGGLRLVADGGVDAPVPEPPRRPWWRAATDRG